MGKRLRFRRIVKWVGTVICAMILLAGAASMYWPSYGLTDGRDWISISGGCIGVIVKDGVVPFRKSAGAYVRAARPHDSWDEVCVSWRKIASLPEIYGDGGVVGMHCPLWIPLLLFGVPTALLWRVDRRREHVGKCPACGYDLTGNVSGRCPECGAAVGAR